MSGAGSYSEGMETLTGDFGGVVERDATDNINLLGGIGLITTGTPGTNQIVFDVVGGGLVWSRVAGPAVALAVHNGYITTNVAPTTLTFTLPAVAAVGDMITIVGEGDGGWIIAQNALQSIQYGNLSSTIGIGGTIGSSQQWDSVSIVCRVANTTWSVHPAPVGILNVV